MSLSDYVTDLRRSVGHRMLLLPGVTAVIVDTQGRYLLARHNDSDTWGLIGGGVEPRESPRDALAREVREELGVEVEILGVIDGYGGEQFHTVYPNNDEVCYVTTAYLCRLRSTQHTLERTEIAEATWFEPTAIQDLDREPWMDRVVADSQAHPARRAR